LFFVGWCVGCNPPFVFCGIQLSGLPAPSGRFLIGVCLPFPLAGQPFHRFHKAFTQQLSMPHLHAPSGRSVSAL
jgi:hypothetical protein